jgi:4-hydroxybenzoate polyprenyltransferase
MGIIGQFFRLFRVGNLFMLAATQYLVYFTVVVPVLKASLFTPSLTSFQFFLLVLSTCCIAAAGYSINNFFDRDIDEANNKNNTSAISQPIKRNAFFVLSAVGIVIGCYLTYAVGLRQIAFVNAVTVGLLYFYSASYKRILFIGNFVVAFLTAIAVFMPAFADYELQYAFRDIRLPAANNAAYNLKVIIGICFAYALFAFLVTLVREIVKDMEDVEGDRLYGCNTLPIVAGNQVAARTAQFFLLLIVLAIGYVQYSQQQWENKPTFLYTTVCIQLPLLVLFVYLFIAKQTNQFKTASLLCKIIMLLGVLSMPIFNYFEG